MKQATGVGLGHSGGGVDGAAVPSSVRLAAKLLHTVAAATGRPGPGIAASGSSGDSSGPMGIPSSTGVAASASASTGSDNRSPSSSGSSSASSSRFLSYVQSLPAHPPALLLSCQGEGGGEGGRLLGAFEYPPLTRAVISYRYRTILQGLCVWSESGMQS